MNRQHLERFRDYVYVDEPRLTRLAEQFRNDVSSCEKPNFSTVEQESPEVYELTVDDKIILAEAGLVARGDLSDHRPTEWVGWTDNQPGRFVKETMVARKVMLPLDETCPVQGLSEFAVWISDPDPRTFTTDKLRWSGTFLYLTEMIWDDVPRSMFYSGVSALQVLVNKATGKDFLDYINEEFEPYGRGRDLHPIEKLRDIGGVASEPRMISSIYRKRYMTDEQRYQYEGESKRVHDLLAYPLYIAAE